MIQTGGHSAPLSPGLHYFAVLMAGLTWFLLFAGALVTSTGSGLAVPDWPLSYGQVFPAMVGGVLYEHGHRLIAGAVAVLWFVFTGLVWKNEKRRWVRVLTYAAALAVVAQALLGGLTVLLRLPPAVSVAHACLGQGFFCLTFLLAFSTSSPWEHALSSSVDGGTGRWLRALSLLLSIGFFAQLVMGAIMRHLGAGLAIPDFPLSFGEWVPPQFSFPIAIHFAHRVGAFILIGLVVATAAVVYQDQTGSLRLVGLSGALLTAVSVQGVLGALVIWMRRPVFPTSIHLSVGALCLALSVLIAVTVFRQQPKEKRVSSLRSLPLKTTWESV